MDRYIAWLLANREVLGVAVDAPHAAVLPDGAVVGALARVRMFGGVNGMLVFHAAEEMRGRARQLVEAGYGYTVLSPAGPNEEFDLD